MLVYELILLCLRTRVNDNNIFIVLKIDFFIPIMGNLLINYKINYKNQAMKTNSIKIRKMLNTLSLAKNVAEQVPIHKFEAHLVEHSKLLAEPQNYSITSSLHNFQLNEDLQLKQSDGGCHTERQKLPVQKKYDIVEVEVEKSFRLKLHSKKFTKVLDTDRSDNSFSNLEQLGIKKKDLSCRTAGNFSYLNTTFLGQKNRKLKKLRTSNTTKTGNTGNRLTRLNFLGIDSANPQKNKKSTTLKKQFRSYQTISGHPHNRTRAESPRRIWKRKDSEITPWQLELNQLQIYPH